MAMMSHLVKIIKAITHSITLPSTLAIHVMQSSALINIMMVVIVLYVIQ